MIQFYSIPEWGKYIAQCKNGEWMVFELEPILKNQEWETEGKKQIVFPVLNSTLNKVISRL